MKKNDIIIVALLLVLWFAWGPLDRHVFRKYFYNAPPVQQQEMLTETAGESEETAVKPPVVLEAPELKPAQEPVEYPAMPETPEESAVPETTAVISNDFLALTVSSRGGTIKSVQLKEYPTSMDEGSAPVELDFGPTGALLLKGLPEGADRDLVVSAGDDSRSVLFSGAMADGIHFERTLSLGDGYVLKIEERIFNEREEAATLSASSITLGEMVTDTNQFQMKGMVYLGVDTLSPGGEKVKHWSKKLNGLFDDPSQTEVRRAIERPVDWAAVKNKYFVQSLRPTGGGDDCVVIVKRAPGTKEVSTVAAEILLTDVTLAPRESTTRAMDFYIGPKKLSELKQLGYHQVDIMELGWTTPIGKFLLYSMNLIHDRLWPYNYGLAIMLLTIIIRIIFWPITHKGTESMRRMGELQPLIKEINEKYKDSPQKKQEAMMALYKEHKVNPMGGCLPMVIQIPVFFALFYILRSAIELRFAGFLWITDLSEPENIISFGFKLPLIGWDALNILPILMAISMAAQQKLTPTAASGDEKQAQMQKSMMTVMPVMMLIFLYNMPSGLALYWTTQNVLMIVQQLIYKKRKEAREAA
ncbi:MAG: membrane protein insertase YidC [Verrucomicrobia bacterium]|nr:membrane protein insertase YidC [Verrucomicrobiota bacterium]